MTTIIRELLYWTSRFVRRNKKLYNFSFKLWKLYCRFTEWKFQEKNCLGRIYIIKRINYGISWYKFEDYGIKWGSIATW